MTSLLSVNNLGIKFQSDGSEVIAVDGIDFEINNTGYGYGNNERLTVAVGGTTGIPTTSSFTPSDVFEIEIEKSLFNDNNDKPHVILLIGVNGSGKTTTAGKIASMLKEKNKKSCNCRVRHF